jgi:CBS domain-containing protein
LVGFASRKPISVPTTATLSEVMNVLTQKHISCLAIVDTKDSSRLVGNFSPSDLRGFGIGSIIQNLVDKFWVLDAELVQMFSYNIVDILKMHSSDSLSPVSVSATETLGVLMARMANSKLHHVWIQDPSGKPEGLITLTDICNLLIKVCDLIFIFLSLL